MLASRILSAIRGCTERAVDQEVASTKIWAFGGLPNTTTVYHRHVRLVFIQEARGEESPELASGRLSRNWSPNFRGRNTKTDTSSPRHFLRFFSRCLGLKGRGMRPITIALHNAACTGIGMILRATKFKVIACLGVPPLSATAHCCIRCGIGVCCSSAAQRLSGVD